MLIKSKCVQLVLIAVSFIVFLSFSRQVSAAVECADRNLNFDSADYVTNELWCSQFVSRFDGQTDYFYLHFPPNFDPTKTYPVILWFRAYGQSEGVLSNPWMFSGNGDFPGVTSLYNAIVIGVAERGDKEGDQTDSNDPLAPKYHNTCSFLGDYTSDDVCPDPSKIPTDANRLAAKKDIQELINQLSYKFNISHVFVGGASMGGYVSFRLLQLYPELLSGVITSAPALCIYASDPPTCTGTRATGSANIYNAASSGKFDDKFIYAVVGDQDDVDGLLNGDRYLNNIMSSRSSLFHYFEVANWGHENFYADDYNSGLDTGESPPCTPPHIENVNHVCVDDHYKGYATNNNYILPTHAWLVDDTPMTSLEEDINSFMSSHPKDALLPTCDWTAPQSEDQWYLSERIRNYGVTKTISGCTQTTDGTGGDGGNGGTDGTTGTTDGTEQPSQGGCSLIIR